MTAGSTEIIYGKKIGRYWYDENGVKSWYAEDLVLEHFSREGFTGTWCEGVTLSLLMKAACFKLLLKHHPLQSYKSVLYSNFHNLCYGLDVSSKEIEDAILSASYYDICTITKKMLDEPWVARNIKRMTYHSDVAVSDVLNLYSCLDVKLLAKMVSVFMSSPLTYKDGWPDLTVTRAGEARFIEVKAGNDSMKLSQITIKNVFAKQFNLNFCEAKVRSKL